MDPTINNVVSTSLVMQQAQAAQQVQMQIFKEALDIQKDQVTALLETAGAGPHLASHGHLGTLIDTIA